MALETLPPLPLMRSVEPQSSHFDLWLKVSSLILTMIPTALFFRSLATSLTLRWIQPPTKHQTSSLFSSQLRSKCSPILACLLTTLYNASCRQEIKEDRVLCLLPLHPFLFHFRETTHSRQRLLSPRFLPFLPLWFTTPVRRLDTRPPLLKDPLPPAKHHTSPLSFCRRWACH